MVVAFYWGVGAAAVFKKEINKAILILCIALPPFRVL
jgi:hypothetical protein